MKFSAALILGLALFSSGALASVPFNIKLPAGFEGPETASRGSTKLFAYVRTNSVTNVKSLFQVTIVTIPAEGRSDSLEKMLSGMLGGIERRRSNFKKSAITKSKLDSAEAVAVDWEGANEGQRLKGRMICAVSSGKLYCLHFQDIAEAWSVSLPQIESAIQKFEFTN